MRTKTLLFTVSMIVCCAVTIIRNESISFNSSILLANIEALTQRESDGTYISNSELKGRTIWVIEYAFVDGMNTPVRIPYSIECCEASNAYNRCELSYHDRRCPSNP